MVHDPLNISAPPPTPPILTSLTKTTLPSLPAGFRNYVILYPSPECLKYFQNHSSVNTTWFLRYIQGKNNFLCHDVDEALANRGSNQSVRISTLLAILALDCELLWVQRFPWKSKQTMKTDVVKPRLHDVLHQKKKHLAPGKQMISWQCPMTSWHHFTTFRSHPHNFPKHRYSLWVHLTGIGNNLTRPWTARRTQTNYLSQAPVVKVHKSSSVKYIHTIVAVFAADY